jgi:hypothetical protein
VGNEGYRYAKNRRVNRAPIPQGRRHTTPIPSDRWRAETREQFVPVLERSGFLPLQGTDRDVRDAWQKNWRRHGVTLRQRLEGQYGRLGRANLTPDQILAEYRRLVLELCPRERLINMDVHPRQWHDDLENLYDCCLNEIPHLQQVLNREIRDAPIRDCNDWEATLGIAAVAEAINSHQRHRFITQRGDDQPFAGGFTLAAADDLSAAFLTSENPLNPDRQIVSRPRRCWMMPLAVGGNLLQAKNAHRARHGIEYQRPVTPGQGHTILAVVKEERITSKPEETQFVTYFVGSDPRWLESAFTFLQRCVKVAARRLERSPHRSADTRVRFKTGTPRRIQV